MLDSLTSWLGDHRDEIDAVVSDMDGVLMLGRVTLPGSVEFLAMLDAWELPWMLLTNDGSRSGVQRQRMLERRGLTVPLERIVTSSDGLVELLASEPGYKELRYYVFGQLGDPCYAEMNGLRVTRDLAELEACDGVIAGEGEHEFDWETTFTAIINFYAKRPGAPFIVPNPDVYYGVSQTQLHVGAGGMARFIQSVLEAHGTPATLHFLGKPHAPIFQHVHHGLEAQAGRIIDPGRVLMLGDNLLGDIRGGNDFGYRTVLLLTGITHEDKLAISDVQPELVARGL